MKTIAELMTDNPGFLDPEERIEEAWRLMRVNHARHIPVCKNGKVVGLVTQKDLLVNSHSPSVLSLPVAEVMVLDVLTVNVDSSVKEGARIMRDRKISCLPVLDNEVLVGIVTDTDYLALVLELLD